VLDLHARVACKNTARGRALAAEPFGQEGPMTAANDTTQGDEESSLDQVREILFGARARDVERKLARLEARLTSEVGALRDEARRRFDEIAEHLRDEIEALSARIDAEANARVAGGAEVGKQVRDGATAVELRLNKLDEAGARGRRELRQQLLDMTREVGEQIARVRGETLDRLAAVTSGEDVASSIGDGSTEVEERVDRPSVH
jgi:hypothetical protein